MSHQLLISPAWADAEAWLLDRISSELLESPLSRARVVVPSFNLVRHLEERLVASGVEGFFGRLFVTLQGLAGEFRIHEPRQDDPVRVPETLRIWRLAQTAQEEVLDAGAMARIRRYPGFVKAADDLIQELQQGGVEPGALSALGEGRASPRLQELGKIYAGYRRMLQVHRWTDAALEMHASAEVLRGSDAVRKIDPLIVFGFDDFSAVQMGMIRALVEAHPGICFVVPFDPTRREAFASVERTVQRLQEVTGVSPTLLTGPSSSGSALSRVRSQVFLPDAPPVTLDGTVRVLTASGAAQMVEAIARELRRLRHEDPSLRWQDCAVIFRSLSPYHRLIREIFPRFGIPFDMPAGKPWSEIRLVRLIRDLLDLKAGGFEKESLLLCLQSASCRVEIDSESLDRLRQLLPLHVPPEKLAEHLIRLADGMVQKAREPSEDEMPEADQRRIEALRASAGEAGSAFGAIADLPERAHLKDYAKGVEKAVKALVRLPELPAGGEDLPPEAGEVAADRQVISDLLEALQALATAWPGEVPFAAFLELFDLVIQEGQVHAPMPRTDAVAFHDALAARGLSFRVVVVAGLLDQEFPAATKPGPFLDEEEREALAAFAGPDAHLPSFLDRTARERTLFVSAMEAARERLYLAYPHTDEAGRTTVPSPVVGEVLRFFAPDGDPAHAPKEVAEYRKYTMRDVLPRDADDLWHAEEAVAWGLDRFYRGEGPGPETGSLLVGMLDGRMCSGGLKAEVTRWHDPRFTGFDGDLAGNEPLLDHLRKAWKGRPLSPTKLDSFGKCPFQFFMGQVLGLEGSEEEKTEISPLEKGNMIHRILERFYRERWDAASGRARPVTEAEETEAVASIRSIAEEVCGSFEARGRVGHPGAWVYEKRRLMTRLGWFIGSEIEHFRTKKNRGLAPAHLEFSFGMTGHLGADPASTDRPLIFSRGDSELRARGIIDRIDVFPEGQAVVIDYKTGSGSSVPTAASVRAGISFQLMVYLLAAEALLGFQPDHGFYLKLGGPLTKSGGFSKTEIKVKELAELRDCVLDFLDAYASDISGGSFPVLPFPANPDAACRYCDFSAACRVDRVRLIEEKQEDAGRFARTRRMRAAGAPDEEDA